jgi:sterol 24-C-methyltransferase
MHVPRIDLAKVKTRLRALHALYTLSQQDIDRFMSSYSLFDGDWSHQNGKHEAQIVDYYRVLNHLCALGNVEKMYIPPVLNPAGGVTGNQVLFEQKMSRDLGLKGGDQALDIGCGRGRVACHLATFTGAHVSGINIDPSQVKNAEDFTRRNGLAGKCRFVQGSVNDQLPFGDSSFDAVYQIQAFTYVKNKEKVFAEIFRVMRPGAKFSYLDWVRLPGFNAANPHHVSSMNRTRAVIGAVDTPSPEEVCDAMKKAGFAILLSKDVSLEGGQGLLINSENDYFASVKKFIDVMVKVWLLPRHFGLLFDRLVKDVDAFIEVDRLGLATTSYQIVGWKPADAS